MAGFVREPLIMVDVFDKQKRSWLMSRVKGRDTKPELFVRSLLHRLGYRFTVNGPKNRKLPGKPDIVLPKYHTVVFVHGCFWHGHEGCKEGRIPKSRTEWWRAKIERNHQRDHKNIAELEAMGWRVVVLWTCEFDRVPKREALARILPDLIEPPAEDRDWPLAAEDPPEFGRLL
ncbi:MAG: DNA mismatch endonuclease Vsr [Opitutales bacterium]